MIAGRPPASFKATTQGRLVTATASRFLQRLATLAMACALPLGLASCGSGAVSDSSGTGSGAISITPSTATLYSDLPTTFVISGGNGSYVVTSNNQAIIGFGGATNDKYRRETEELKAQLLRKDQWVADLEEMVRDLQNS